MAELIEILSNAGIRHSYQRLSILEVLRSTKEHPTADRIYDMLKEQSYTGISKATLYNTLQLFVEKGIITQVDMHSSEAHYEPNVIFHPHFICEKCGKIIDCEGCIPKFELPEGFRINKFTMNISGICSECSKKNTDESHS